MRLSRKDPKEQSVPTLPSSVAPSIIHVDKEIDDLVHFMVKNRFQSSLYASVATSTSVSGFEEPPRVLDTALDKMVQESIDRLMPPVIKELMGQIKDLQEQITEIWEELKDE